MLFPPGEMDGNSEQMIEDEYVVSYTQYTTQGYCHT